MFIKIVRESVETLYECARFTKRPAPGDFNNVELQLEGTPCQAIGVIYDARDTDVYVMNEHGVTVEAHRYDRSGQR